MISPSQILDAATASGRRLLSEPEAKSIIAAFGIPVPRHYVLGRTEDPGAAVKSLRPPLALKVISPDVSHKSDVGGVRLGLSGEEEVRSAMGRLDALPGLAGRRIDGFLLEEMAGAGHEIAVGGMVDESFGPAVMIGLGGILVEILNDVSFRLCPITRADAEDMLGELRGRAILSGARGGAPADTGAIVDILLRVGGEGGLFPALASRIEELDINPLIAGPTGAIAVDARIVLRERS